MTSKNKAPRVRTLADLATDKDNLFYDGYVKGIAEFIKECATPTTIAIQGDWGSGKTSLINLLDAELRAESEVADSELAEDGIADDELAESEVADDGFIETKPAKSGSALAAEYCEDIIGVAAIDAWQQSVANPQSSLLENLLVEMLLKLSGVKREDAEGIASLVTAVSTIMGTGSNKKEMAKDDSLLGTIFDSIFGAEDNQKFGSKDEFISSKDIEDFRIEFSGALQRAAQKSGKSRDSRLVVFVDGLDHVDPEACITLMEQVKTYLDCPRCVFVYAIDERTVYDGVRKKLGDKVDEGRKKMFFEKLVRVPLRIPTSVYNLEKYIEVLLKDDQDISGAYAKVISTLMDNPTPLSIKRFINTLYLYRSVFGEVGSADTSTLDMLLAAVILEIESTQGFNTVADCAKGDEATFEERLKEAQGSLSHEGHINWHKLPTLWHGEDGASVDAAKRDAFISWMRKLK